MTVVLFMQTAMDYWRCLRTVGLRRNGISKWRDDLQAGVIAVHDAAVNLASGMRSSACGVAPFLDAGQACDVLDRAVVPDARELARAVGAASLLGLLKPPIHVAVSSREKASPARLTRAHVYRGALFDGALAKAAPGVYVCTPELAFASMARALSRPKLVRAGLELCGGYALSEGTSRGFVDCLNVTTPERLRGVLERGMGLGSKAKAVVAAGRIVAGAASPAESSLFIDLTSPVREGGCGIPVCELNGPISAAGVYGGSAGFPGDEPAYRRYLDLFWRDSMFAIGYEGMLSHGGHERFVQDSSRRAELAALGVSVITVTARQARSLREAEQIRALVYKKLGMRPPHVPADYPERKAALHRELYG